MILDRNLDGSTYQSGSRTHAGKAHENALYIVEKPKLESHAITTPDFN
jgi:hypothetical protein